MYRFGVVLFASVFILSCKGLPYGAPKSACSSLTPSHHGIPVQSTPSPYSVSAERNGDKIKVKISSPDGEEFMGFILQPRSSEDKSRMIDGKFTPTDGVSQTIDCSEGTQNTLTHVDPSLKKEVVTEWTPSGEVNEDIIFRATVAKSFEQFWTEIDSQPLRIDDAGASTQQA